MVFDGLVWIFWVEIICFKYWIFFWNNLYFEGFNFRFVFLNLRKIFLRFDRVILKLVLNIMILLR